MSSRIPLSALAEHYTPEFTQFLARLGEIAQTINVVEMVTPVNAGEEKRRWLAEYDECKKWAEPRFQYDRNLLAGVAKLTQQIRDLYGPMLDAFETMSRSSAGRALCELARNRYSETLMMTSLAEDMLDEIDRDIARDLRSIYGYPKTEVVEQAFGYAHQLIDGTGLTYGSDDPKLKWLRDELKDKLMDAQLIRESFVWMAQKCGIADTRPVVINEHATAIDVRDRSSQGAVVVIPADRQVSMRKLTELVGHEILCHWQDSERAAKVLPLLGAGALKPADEVLYEGHATLTDFNTHLWMGDKSPLQQKPYYVMAMSMAKEGMSFAEVAQNVYDYVRPTTLSDMVALTQTWTACFRVFRGSTRMNDIVTGYAFTKDRAYFEGRMLAQKLHDEKQDGILQLGTLSMADIDILKDAVEFEPDDGDQERTKLLLQKLIRWLLDEEIVF